VSASSRAAKATNLSIDNDLVVEARRLGINVSRAAEAGLREAVREARAAEWRRENAEAIASANAWVEAIGLPLARYRQF
jgi:antitoxin CcdA